MQLVKMRMLLQVLIGMLAIALVVIGVTGMVASNFAAAQYGIEAATESTRAYVRALAARDLSIGGMLLVLLACRVDTRILGIAALILTAVPITDAIGVFQVTGAHSPALLLHAGSVPLLVALGVTLIRVSRSSS